MFLIDSTPTYWKLIVAKKVAFFVCNKASTTVIDGSYIQLNINAVRFRITITRKL